MTNIKQLRKELKKARAKAARDQEEKDLKKELFELRNKKKLALVRNVKGNLADLAKAIAKKSKGKKKKKTNKKSYDPFKNVNFKAFS